MFDDFITKHTDIFSEKMREAFALQKFHTIFQQKILAYFKMFEILILTNNLVSFEQPGARDAGL